MRFWKPRPTPGDPLVGIAVAAYVPDADDRRAAALRCLVASFQAQTYRNWRLEITHDGPYPHDPATLRFFDQWDGEPRVSVVETPEHAGRYGHPHRQAAVDRLLAAGCQWTCMTNQDNYYAPVFLEALLSAALTKPATLAYCDCVHSHKLWAPLPAKLQRGHIDMGSFIAHRSIVEKAELEGTDFAADWQYLARLTRLGGGTAYVPGYFFTHN